MKQVLLINPPGPENTPRERLVVEVIQTHCRLLSRIAEILNLAALRDNLTEALISSKDAEQWCGEDELEGQQKNSDRLSRMVRIVEALEMCVTEGTRISRYAVAHSANDALAGASRTAEKSANV